MWSVSKCLMKVNNKPKRKLTINFSLWQEDPWCDFSQLHKPNNSKILPFHYLVWFSVDMARQFSILTLIKFPIWPSWTWGDGATIRGHPEKRRRTDWLSPDFLDVTLAGDDHPGCKMPLLQWRFEAGSSLVWRVDGKLLATTSSLAEMHTGVKPILALLHSTLSLDKI